MWSVDVSGAEEVSMTQGALKFRFHLETNRGCDPLRCRCGDM